MYSGFRRRKISLILENNARRSSTPHYDGGKPFIICKLSISEPNEGSLATVIEPAQLGGTRHIAAAQFTHDQRDALAMVASQDGRFTLFG